LKQLKIGFDLDEVILFWLFFLKKNAKEVLARLIDQGHLVKIVTARSGFMLFLATITLKIYGLGDIEIVGVGKNGYKYKELIGFHIYVDDKVLKNFTFLAKSQKMVLSIFLIGGKYFGRCNGLPTDKKLVV